MCADRAAELVVAPAHSGLELLAQGDHQQRNFAVARAAAEAYHGPLDDARRPRGGRRDARARPLPDRRRRAGDDHRRRAQRGGHGGAGDSLRAFAGGRRLVAVVSVLDDKDAVGMLRELLPLCAEVIYTQSASPRALPAGTLESLSGQVGGPPARTVAEPRRALAVAREAAGPDGVAVATGSIYLIADLLRPEGARGRSML